MNRIFDDVISLSFMINDYETSIDNSNVCEVFDLLHIELEDELMLKGYPHFENINDVHSHDNISSFSFKNNLEQISLIHDLTFIQGFHDNVPLEINCFEVVLLKDDVDNSTTREAFHCS